MTAAAFTAAFTAHRAALLAVARGFVPADDAEDVVQVATLACWRGRHHFRGDCPLYHWLAAAVRNHARKLIQYRQRLRRIPAAELLQFQDWDETISTLREPDPRAGIDLPVVDAILEAALNRLPPCRRAVLEARETTGDDYCRLAARFRTSPAAVRKRVHRARAGLARAILADRRTAELLAA